MIIVVLGINLLLGTVIPISAEDFELDGRDCGIWEHPRLIVNGSAAAPGQFPSMVQVRMFVTPTGFIPCGGTIITRRHVLTAAHCLHLKGWNVLRVEVAYGNTDFREARTVHVVKKMAHQGFSSETMANDIAILLVEKPFQFSATVKPACLPTRKMNLLGRDVVAAGWGSRKEGGDGGSRHLEYAILNVVPDIQCQMPFPTLYRPDIMLCTHNGYSSTCMGDSGGPLFLKVSTNRFVQVGVTSFGTKTCRRVPNVFTRLDAFVSWIKENIGKHRAYEVVAPYVPPIHRAISFIKPYSFSLGGIPYKVPEPYFPL